MQRKTKADEKKVRFAPAPRWTQLNATTPVTTTHSVPTGSWSMKPSPGWANRLLALRDSGGKHESDKSGDAEE